jgi:hypothetical protein
MTVVSHTEIGSSATYAARQRRAIGDDLTGVFLWSALGLTVSALVLYTFGLGFEGDFLTILG